MSKEGFVPCDSESSTNSSNSWWEYMPTTKNILSYSAIVIVGAVGGYSLCYMMHA